ncbi:hypothetical protein Tco_0712842 [Tanacetum coccineum]
MAEEEIDNLTMEQYLALTRGNQAPGVVKQKIGGNVNFEIKNQFMRELMEDTLSRNKNDDAHEHVVRVLDIISLFNIPRVSHDAIMLRVFPITLTGAAKRWMDRLLLGIVDSWDLLKKPLSKGTVHHQRLASSLKKSVTSSKKEMKHYTKLGNGYPDNEEQETDDSGMIEAVAALEATLKKKREEPKNVKQNVNYYVNPYEPPIPFPKRLEHHDIRMPIILGRPLLATAHAQVDIFRKTISLEVRSKKVIFKIRSSFTTTNFESVRSIKSETFIEDDNLKEIDYDLLLYDSESCEFNRWLGMTYEELTLILIEKVKVTRYTIGLGETYTKVKVLGVEKIPRTRDNVAAMRARLMKKWPKKEITKQRCRASRV